MAKPTIHDALIHIMVMVSASDNVMSDGELARIGQLVRMLPVFRGYDPAGLVATAAGCSVTLQEKDGLLQVLKDASAVLPAHLHETAYALAVEIAAADLRLEQEELRLLQIIRDHFKLDRLACAAIERSARARHQTA
jgi:tellurite resistance protein